MNYLDSKKSATSSIFKWVQAHYGYSNILMGIFMALWTKLFFRKDQFNFFEILILFCFVMSMGMLIYSVFAIIQGLTHINLMQVGAVVGLIYTTYSIGQFFDKRKPMSYFKALFAYILVAISFYLIATAITIDLIMKK